MGNGYQTWTRAAKQVRGAMTDGGGRSHKAPRLDEGSSREDGARLPRHMESLRNLMFRGAEERLPRRISAGRVPQFQEYAHYLSKLCAREALPAGPMPLCTDLQAADLCTRVMAADQLGAGPKAGNVPESSLSACVCPGVMSGCPFTSEAHRGTSCMAACGGASYRRFLSSYK
jgi:hypothetical protein